ncbi:nutrient reservoir, partial [Rhizoctonia solani]
FAVLKLQLIGTSIESDHGFTPSLAGPAASSIPAEAVTVDDNDLTRVSYSVGWDPAVQTSQYHAFHYGNTMHRTSQTGAYASFKFNGTAAWYYTDLSPGHGKVNVTLDGERSWLVSGDATFISAQRVLWNVSHLPYGEHTVVITHQDTAGLWATLDFFR